jgi:cytochrome c oxidase subunit IV
MSTSETQRNGIGVYLAVYVVILLIAALQIMLAYQHVDTSRTLLRMLSLAIIQAGLAVLFFMHMRSERRILAMTLIPVTIFVLLMMNMIWTDSFRILHSVTGSG